MRVDPARVKALNDALSSVRARISAVGMERRVRLVAVSKLKPASDILALHSAPHSHEHFGENYLQELQTKAALLPRTVAWHFIGALQTNKCAALAQIPNLYAVSSVDSAKKADALNKGRERLLSEAGAGDDHPERRLRVHVQVNTSGEASKAGVAPDDAGALCAHIRAACPHLRLAGLMTIGALARSQQAGSADAQNEDFVALRAARDRVQQELAPAHADGAVADDDDDDDGATRLELSMGMSDDFESAIAAGSDEVRVGSTIFGARPPKSEARVVNEVKGDGH